MEEQLAMKRTTMRQNMKNKSEIIASNRKRLLNNDTPFAIREACRHLSKGEDKPQTSCGHKFRQMHRVFC